MICDDDEAISEMIKIMLESRGYQAEVFSSGKAIQKRVKQVQPNLILIDIWMPGIDGKEAIKLLKKDPQTSKTPIIIISALHKNEILKIVQNIGAEGFLLKPFNIEDLFSTVKQYAI